MLEKDQDPENQQHWNFAQWHLQAKTFKRIIDWSDHINTKESSDKYAKTFNPWIPEWQFNPWIPKNNLHSFLNNYYMYKHNIQTRI